MRQWRWLNGVADRSSECWCITAVPCSGAGGAGPAAESGVAGRDAPIEVEQVHEAAQPLGQHVPRDGLAVYRLVLVGLRHGVGHVRRRKVTACSPQAHPFENTLGRQERTSRGGGAAPRPRAQGGLLLRARPLAMASLTCGHSSECPAPITSSKRRAGLGQEGPPLPWRVTPPTARRRPRLPLPCRRAGLPGRCAGWSAAPASC